MKWFETGKPLVALAPMDGWTDSAFRRVVRAVSAQAIVFTEFTSAEGLHHDAQRIKDKFRFHPEEHPVVAQIFGANKESFVYAAQWLTEQGFDGIDINMGCPSKTVVKSEQGVALRKCPAKAFELIEAVAQATHLPVSVKTRLGLKDASDLVEFGRGARDAGAQLLTIHARTYAVPYNCPADFAPVYALKSDIGIPVIGNGGIISLQDGAEKLGNLDGFMIGRGAMGNPWVFSDTPPKTFAEKIPLMKKHVEYIVELKGEKYGLLEARKHLFAYIKGFPYAHEVRDGVLSATTVGGVLAVLDAIQ